jgi:hypothetical protein
MIIYEYLSSGTSHEIHSSESINIKLPRGTFPLEAFFDSYPCKKPKPSRSWGGSWYLTQTALAKSYEPVKLSKIFWQINNAQGLSLKLIRSCKLDNSGTE